MRRAFTLIELLVVIGIIIVLASLLVPTIATYQRHAIETRTRALLAKVATAIDLYQQDRKQLPFCDTWSDPGSWAWVEGNNARLFTELASTDSDHRGNPRPGYLRGELRPADISDRRLIDPWGRPIIYYAPTAAGAWSTIATPFAGNAASFEIWSAGADRTFADLRSTLAGARADPDADNIGARSYDPEQRK